MSIKHKYMRVRRIHQSTHRNFWQSEGASNREEKKTEKKKMELCAPLITLLSDRELQLRPWDDNYT